jgi:hypothetical protein
VVVRKVCGFIGLSVVVGLGGSGVAAGVGLDGCGGGCVWWGGEIVVVAAGPDEPTVLVPLCKNADEAGLVIKYSSDFLSCDARIAPCGGDGQAHLVFRGSVCAGG